MQLVVWGADFCEALAAKGFFVIVFDTRDTRLSTVIEAGGDPPLVKVFAQKQLGILLERKDGTSAHRCLALSAPNSSDLKRRRRRISSSRAACSLRAGIPYFLKDMAADVLGLLDVLEVKAAHVCGFSMASPARPRSGLLPEPRAGGKPCASAPCAASWQD